MSRLVSRRDLHKLSEGIILAGVNYIRNLDYQDFFGDTAMVSVLKDKGLASVAQAVRGGVIRCDNPVVRRVADQGHDEGLHRISS